MFSLGTQELVILIPIGIVVALAERENDHEHGSRGLTRAGSVYYPDALRGN